MNTQRNDFIWVTTCLLVLCLGCTKPVEKKAGSSSDTVQSKSSKSSSESEEIPETYQNTSLEVLFSRVLSRGFRKPSKRNNISVERCRTAMMALVSRGDTSRRFLETKLSEGSLGEKALALWSLGSMGPAAVEAHRSISKSMLRSWQIPIERCRRKGGDDAACQQKVLQKSAPWTIEAGCRALRNLGSRTGIEQVAQQGLSGQMALPCLSMYVDHNQRPTVRDRLIESFELPQVSQALRQAFTANPKSALSFALYWLRQEKHKAEVRVCPLQQVLGNKNSALMKSLSGRLHGEELGSLKALGDELTHPLLKQCARDYLEYLGPANSGGLIKVKKTEKIDTTAYFDVGDFCPADTP